MAPLAMRTDTAGEVVRFPNPSRATAVSRCEPFDAVVVFHEIEYGDVVSSAPIWVPSSRNFTPPMPPGSDAAAESVTVALTDALFVGVEIETSGPVLSTFTEMGVAG